METSRKLRAVEKFGFFFPRKCFLCLAMCPSAIAAAVCLLPEGIFLCPSSSNRLLLTPAACVCRVPRRLAPVGSILPLWAERAALMVGDLLPQSQTSPCYLAVCVQRIDLAMRLGLQDSSAKELRRKVAAHSAFDLFFRHCPRKWEGAATSAFPSGAIHVPRCLSQ